MTLNYQMERPLAEHEGWNAKNRYAFGRYVLELTP